MKIKVIIFDLDGVLVDSRKMHYESLNKALKEIAPTYAISLEEHLSTFDGLSTTKKLTLLTKKGLDQSLHTSIWQAKQKYTNKAIDKYTYDERIRSILSSLKTEGYTLHVASNSIHSTVKQILLKKGYMEYIDYFASNESVRMPKPSAEIYFHCMTQANASVQETMILEDSHIGRKAALGSGAHLLPIENPEDLTLEKIHYFIELVNKKKEEDMKWLGRCNIVIPMAGNGSRFAEAGYKMPKPLIDVRGKPMIQWVIENLQFDTQHARFIFIVRKEHIERYQVHYLLNLMAPGCIIIPVGKVTEGAASSILLAKEYINNDEHLFLANSDQFVEWNCNEFMYSMIEKSVDGGIATFEADHPKWSYAKLDEKTGYVSEVAEKVRISDHATVGFYYWKRGADFVNYATQMIEKNIRVNGEFYTCPVFNEAIQDGKKIKIFQVKRMWGLGVPMDLEYFLANY